MSDIDYEFEVSCINGKKPTEETIRLLFKSLTKASQGTPEEPQYYPKMISYSKQRIGHYDFKFLMKIKGC